MVNDNCIMAVVVLYNPNDSVINNIATYQQHIKKTIIVDNSERVNITIINELGKMPNIEIIINNKNIGIAAALNIGIEKAITNGANWILTMDQDSFFEDDMMGKYIS